MQRKQNKGENKRKKHSFSIQYKIMGITIIPLVFLGIVVSVIAQTLVKDAMINEVQNTLKSSAEAMYAAYDQNTGDYFEAKNGDIWKGGYNISQSSGLLDAFKKDADTEIERFWAVFAYGMTLTHFRKKTKKNRYIFSRKSGDISPCG